MTETFSDSDEDDKWMAALIAELEAPRNSGLPPGPLEELRDCADEHINMLNLLNHTMSCMPHHQPCHEDMASNSH